MTQTIKQKELDVVQLIAEGYAAKEIADKLGISVVTVNGRKNNARNKLDAKSGSNLVAICMENNLIKPQL